MTWFVSLLMAGSLLVSGSGAPNTATTTSERGAEAIASSSQDEKERFDQTYPFDMDGTIEISNINGDITVEAWDSPQIQLEAVKTADSRERLADVEIKIDATQSRFSVTADYKPWKDRVRAEGEENKKYSKLSVEFKLRVPSTATLKEIETINGSVTISNMRTYTEVSAVNGSVTATNLRGTAKLSTVNGTVTGDFDDLNGDSSISLMTVNGTVKLALPSNTNATVKANSVNGEISNDFGLPVRKGKYVGRDLYGRIGSGEVKVRLNSVNGGIEIGAKKDGGRPNPAVDLLPQKTSDDFDEAFEMEFGKMNVEMDRALEESAAKIALSKKNVEEAMKAMESSLKVVVPEIALSAEAVAAATAAIDREKLEEKLQAERIRIEAELARASEAMYMGRSPFVEEKSGQFEVSGKPKVTIDAGNCMVSVRGWDRNEVKYSVTRLKRSTEAEGVDVEVTKDGNDVKLDVKGSGARSAEFLNRVRLEVFVPRKADLKIVTDGEVRLDGVTGEMELVGSRNSVNVRDSKGTLRIEETKGTVRVIGFEGDLTTRAIKGDVYLDGEFANISSTEGSGTVFLTLSGGTDALITAGSIEFEDAVALNDQTYRLGALDLVRQDTNSWKAGKGTGKYIIKQDKGGLQLRPRSATFIN